MYFFCVSGVLNIRDSNTVAEEFITWAKESRLWGQSLNVTCVCEFITFAHCSRLPHFMVYRCHQHFWPLKSVNWKLIKPPEVCWGKGGRLDCHLSSFIQWCVRLAPPTGSEAKKQWRLLHYSIDSRGYLSVMLPKRKKAWQKASQPFRLVYRHFRCK
jgi:hypothetical protein